MNLPNEVISIVFSFLDGNSLLNCENVSKAFYELTDNLHFWKRAVKAQFPLLHNDDIITYSGEWKKLFLDKNKQNHSTSFEWKIDKFSTKTERQISPTFTLKNHTFNLIVDPMGNQNVNDVQGVSVYLNWFYNSNHPECGCFYNLYVCNQDSKKNIKWNDEEITYFNQNKLNWGIHNLLPFSKLNDPKSGFIIDDTLHIKVNIKIYFITLKIIQNKDIENNNGIGVFDKCSNFYTVKINQGISVKRFSELYHVQGFWIYSESDDSFSLIKISDFSPETLLTEIINKYVDERNIAYIWIHNNFSETIYNHIAIIKWLEPETKKLSYLVDFTCLNDTNISSFVSNFCRNY